MKTEEWKWYGRALFPVVAPIVTNGDGPPPLLVREADDMNPRVERMIAAAPRMLATLEKVYEYLELGSNNPRGARDALVIEVRDAMSKAREGFI